MYRLIFSAFCATLYSSKKCWLIPATWKMLTEKHIGKGTKVFPLAKIAEGAVIGVDCKISTKAVIGNCRIGHGCKIGFNSVIEDGACLGNGVIVENNVIVHGVSLGNNCYLERHCEVWTDLGRNVKVGAFSKVW